MDNSEHKIEDEIPTPSTSRSNSLNDEEDQTLPPVILRMNDETIENESSSSPRSRLSNVSEQIKATIANKRDTFVSDSSSSTAASEQEDFVAVDRNDFDSMVLNAHQLNNHYR